MAIVTIAAALPAAVISTRDAHASHGSVPMGASDCVDAADGGTTLTFENATGIDVGDFYAGSGVRFPSTSQTRAIFYANADERNTISPPTTVANNASDGFTSANVPLTITFDQAHSRVGMYIGNNAYGFNPAATLTLYDATGAVLGSTTLAGGSFGNDVTTFIGLEHPGGGIRKVTLDYGNTTLSEEIDNLCFGSPPPAPEVDQSQPTIDNTVGGNVLGGANDQRIAQVVRAGAGGELTAIRVPVACSSGDLVVKIQDYFPGFAGPVFTGGTTTTYPGSKLPSFFPNPATLRTIPLAEPVPMALGKKFGIVLSSTGSCAVFQGPAGDPYPAGSAYYTSTEPAITGWVPIGAGRDDIPFQTLMRPDTTPPIVQMTSPLMRAYLRQTFTVTADASDDVEVASVQFFVTKGEIMTSVGVDTTAPYSVSINSTTLADSNATQLNAQATDAAGNKSFFSGRIVTVDNTPPTAVVTKPAADNLVVFDSVAVAGTATDATAGVKAVVFSSPTLDFSSFPHIATIDLPTSSDVSATWNAASVEDGDRYVRMEVVDRAGNAASVFRRVTVNNKPKAARLVVAQQGDVDSLDPAVAASPLSWQVLRNTCTTLYGYAIVDGEFVPTPKPAAAQAVTISNFGKTYTLTLRSGLTFEDGEPITAHSYRRAFLRSLAPGTATALTAGFDVIAGAAAYRTGGVPDIEGIVVKDENVLAITLTRRSGFFPSLLTTPPTCPIPVEAPAPAVATPTVIPSSGPYKVLRRVPGHQIWLGRNDAYTGASPQNSADIVVNVFQPGPTTGADVLAEVEAGRADYTPNVLVSERSRLDSLYGPGSSAAEEGSQQYFRPKTAGVQAIHLNRADPVFSNPVLMRAIELVTRRSEYASLIGLPPTDQMLAEPMPGYVDVRLHDEPDAAAIAEATELLSSNNLGGIGLEILVTSGNARVAAAEALAADLRAIGLQPSISALPPGVVFPRMSAGDYQIGFVGWIAGALDPYETLYPLFHSSQIGKNNFSRVADEALDAEIEAADALSGQARYDAFTKLDHKVSTGYGAIPYASVTAADFYEADVGCQVYDPLVGVVWGALCSRSLASTVTLTATSAARAGAAAVDIGDVPFAQLSSGGGPVGTELGGIALLGAELGGIGVSGAELGGIELGGIELGGIELGGIELGGIELGGIGLDEPSVLAELTDIPLSSIEVNVPGGWPFLLTGTPLQGVPPQNVTLAQLVPLLSAASSPPQLQGLTLAQISVAGTELGGIELGGIALAGIELGGISILGATGQQNLVDWCDVLSDVGYTACDPATIGNRTLVGLALSGVELGGIELGGIELGGIPLAGTELGGIELGGIELGGIELGGITLAGTELGGIELGGIDMAASELGGIELGGIDMAASELGGIELGGIANPAAVVDCALVDCTNPTLTLAQADLAGAILTTARLRDLAGAFGTIKLSALQGLLTGFTLADLGFYGDVTLADIAELIPDGMTLGELLQGMLNPADLPWEDLSLNGVALQTLDASSSPVNYTATFSVDGALGAQAATEVSVTLPAGFLYVPGSSVSGPAAGLSTAIPDPEQSGRRLTWNLEALTVGADYEIRFNAYSGLRLGVGAATAAATLAGGAPTAAAAPANTVVLDTFEPNNDPLGTQTVSPNVLYFSYTASGDDVDYFKFPAPAPGSRINVYLSHLDYDADLVLFSPQQEQIIETASTGIALAGEPVLDAGLVSESSTLAPEALADVPTPSGLTIAGFSVNRGTESEQVRTVAHASGGEYRIQVSGYNGAASTSPYMLRVEISQPFTPSCTPRNLDYTGTTRGTLPGTWSGLGLNTLFLFNRERFAAAHGEAQATSVYEALAGDGTLLNPGLANRSDLGVDGYVLQVDGSQAVRDAYAAWDANPCSPSGANGVVGAIVDLVEAARAANPDLENVVLVGSDDIVPHARIPDLTQQYNERQFAREFADNQYFGSFATQNILSDDPYGDRDPLPYLDRQLFIPDDALGRLVETPSQILGTVARFQHATVQGVIDPQSAGITGYDFLTDGSNAIASALSNNGITTSTLISDTWDKSALDLLVKPSGGASPDVLSVNAHYDPDELLPALGNTLGDETDLYATPDLPDPALGLLEDAVAFTMGCHAGLSVSDVVLGTPNLDWAEAFAKQRAAAFVGNSGYGLGDTEVIAYTERFMKLFAENLDGSMSLGAAAIAAKREYFLGLSPFGVYDEKVMSQTIFYGLPMYRLPGSSTPATASVSANVLPDPATGLEAAAFEVGATTDPGSAEPLKLRRNDTSRGTYYDASGDVQVTHYRPIQPRTQTGATAPNKIAHGALILAATSSDVTGINPVYAMPAADLAATAPEPTWQDVAFPTKLAAVTTASGPNGLEQQLVVSLGQFFDDGVADAGGTGTQRLYTNLSGLVYYNASADREPAPIDSVEGSVLDGTIAFTVDTRDAVRVYVLFKDASGTWKGGDLTRHETSNRWNGAFPVVGNRAEYTVQTVDAHGNVGVAAGKDVFIATASPPPPPAIDVSVAGTPGNGDWLVSDATVSLRSSNGAALEYSVDGAAFTGYAGQFAVTGNAVHRVEFRSASGREGHTLVAIDKTAPTIDFRSPANGSKHKLAANVEVDFECADDGSSGVDDCDATRTGAGSIADGSFIDTSSDGAATIIVNASDIAGNTEQAVHSTEWFADSAPSRPGTPTLVGPNPNQGLFVLEWLASTDTHGDPIVYGLRHKDADDTAYSDVATLFANAFVASPEIEGTWTYEVDASDGALTSAASAPSAPVKVDQTPPNAPTAVFDRAPEDVAGGWFADVATLSWQANGDPALRDGSAGSGVDSVTAPETFGTSGTYARTGTATDAAGLSSSTEATVKVDATPPTVTLKCIGTYLGFAATGSWRVVDFESGPVGGTAGVPLGGTISLDTSTLGTKIASVTFYDRVGHEVTATCTYTVIYRFAGFYAPVANLPTLNLVNAGRGVPVKFSLGGNQGLAIFPIGSPASQPITCDSGAPTGEVTETINAGSSSLAYDAATDQYTYTWKTDRAWAGTCRQLQVKLIDGRTYVANFKFR